MNATIRNEHKQRTLTIARRRAKRVGAPAISPPPVASAHVYLHTPVSDVGNNRDRPVVVYGAQSDRLAWEVPVLYGCLAREPSAGQQHNDAWIRLFMDRREIKARIVTEVHRSFHNETGLDAVFDGDIGIADRSGAPVNFRLKIIDSPT